MLSWVTPQISIGFDRLVMPRSYLVVDEDLSPLLAF